MLFIIINVCDSSIYYVFIMVLDLSARRHDIQHNDTEHNDTPQKWNSVLQHSSIMIGVFMLSLAFYLL